MNRNILLLIILSLVLIVLILIYPCFINQGHFREFVFVDIATSLVVGLISAFVIIVLIEDRDERLAAKLKNQRQSVVINKMIVAIRDFNVLVAKMYKATSTDAVSDFQERHENLFYEVDTLYKQINMLDLTKDGSMLNSANMKPVLWIDLFCSRLGSYLNRISTIEENYLFLIDGNFVKEIENISGKKIAFDDLSYLDVLKITDGGYNSTVKKETETSNEVYDEKVIFRVWGFYDVISSTAKLMNLIDANTNKKNFVLPSEILLREDVSPKCGSGLMF